MTSTERIRSLLDERGVEWWEGEDERKTHWRSNGLTWEYFNTENGDAWLGFLGACESDISPEQAIEATLGRGECRNECKATESFFYCSECGCAHLRNPAYVDMPRYCPNCGRRVMA